MPRRRMDARLFELAKRGAEMRFHELAQEAKNLIGLFPHLHDSFDQDELPISFILAKGAGRLTRASPQRPRQRGRVSAAVRRAVSARMKR